jgi:hypothetical protein
VRDEASWLRAAPLRRFAIVVSVAIRVQVPGLLARHVGIVIVDLVVAIVIDRVADLVFARIYPSERVVAVAGGLHVFVGRREAARQ